MHGLKLPITGSTQCGNSFGVKKATEIAVRTCVAVVWCRTLIFYGRKTVLLAVSAALKLGALAWRFLGRILTSTIPTHACHAVKEAAVSGAPVPARDTLLRMLNGAQTESQSWKCVSTCGDGNWRSSTLWQRCLLAHCSHTSPRPPPNLRVAALESPQNNVVLLV